MPHRNQQLTRRETDVLRDIANDLSTREIAEKYGVTPGTISTYRHSILRKSGCRSSAGAVMKLLAGPQVTQQP